MKRLLPYIVEKLAQFNTKYEIHSFASGALMVDLWVDSNFYVIQIDGDVIGLSLVTDESMPFDRAADQSFKDEISFKEVFERIFIDIQPKTTIVINGDNFSTLEGFYSEVDKVLTRGIGWKTGHNFAAFNDLLRGGFGVHAYEEAIKLIWQHSDKSKIDLNAVRQGETVYEMLKRIIKEHTHIEFIES